jgi:hypothetical protein
MSATRAQVVAVARSYLGTPFHHQGRRPGVGLDCAGVPICVSRQLGLVPPDFDIGGYARRPDGRSLQAYCEQHMRRVRFEDIQPGDAVLVSWKDGPPQHLGIIYPHAYDFADGRRWLGMVHAEEQKHARVIETRLLFTRVMRFVAAYALPGIEP